MADPNNTRDRLAIVEVQPAALAGWLLHGVGSPHQRIVPTHDWPDLEIVAVRESPPWRATIDLLCRSSAFAVVDPAVEWPRMRLTFRLETDDCMGGVR